MKCRCPMHSFELNEQDPVPKNMVVITLHSVSDRIGNASEPLGKPAETAPVSSAVAFDAPHHEELLVCGSDDRENQCHRRDLVWKLM